MRLLYLDKRPISELTDFVPSGPIMTRPIGFTATISETGAAMLSEQRPDFFHAEEVDARFTLTIDEIRGVSIKGTIRRR